MQTIMLSCFFMLTLNVSAGVYYVSNSGDNANDGRAADRALQYIGTAIANATHGDEIRVLPGKYYAVEIDGIDDLTVHAWPNVVDTSHADFDSVFDPDNPVATPYSDRNAVLNRIRVDNADNVNVDGFEVTGYRSPALVSFRNTNRLTIQNCFFHDGSRAIRSDDHTNHETVIRANRIWRCASIGIEILGRGWVIEDNHVDHLLQSRTDTGAEFDPGADVDCIRPFGARHVIRNNYLGPLLYEEQIIKTPQGGPHMDAVQTFSNNDDQYLYNLLLENNVLYGTNQHFHMSDMHGGQVAGIVIRNNVLQKSGARSINVSIDRPVGNVSIFNNLFADIRYEAVFVAGSAFCIANNALVRTTERRNDTGPTIIWTNNLRDDLFVVPDMLGRDGVWQTDDDPVLGAFAVDAGMAPDIIATVATDPVHGTFDAWNSDWYGQPRTTPWDVGPVENQSIENRLQRLEKRIKLLETFHSIRQP